MVEQRVNHIAVTTVAPEREVCKAEADRVLRVCTVMRYHMALHISAAPYRLAARLETEPILSFVFTVRAWILDIDVFECILRCDVVLCAMGAVAFGGHGMETLSNVCCCHLKLLLNTSISFISLISLFG